VRRNTAALALLAGVLGPTRADHEPDFGVRRMEVVGAFGGYWWDHTALTVAVIGDADVPGYADDAVRRAIGIWNKAIPHRHGPGFVELAVVGDRQAAEADIVVDLRRGGGRPGSRGLGQGVAWRHSQVRVP
jgi:hypothetical protein